MLKQNSLIYNSDLIIFKTKYIQLLIVLFYQLQDNVKFDCRPELETKGPSGEILYL